MNILSIPSSFYNIIKSFQIYNLLLLLLSTFLWCKIAAHFNLNLKFVWLGFVFWFLNFGIAELSFYYPVLTDATAICLGFFLLYAYLKDNLILKIIITFLGAFTWAGFVFLGILLIMFPVNVKLFVNETVTEHIKPKKRFLIFLLPLPFLVEGVYHFNRFLNNERIPYIETDIINHTLYISVFLNYLLMAYFFSVYIPNYLNLKTFPGFLKKVITSVKPLHAIISVALFLAIYAIQKKLSNDLPTDNSFSKMFYLISLYGATKPLVYVFSYVNYFGPAFIFFFLCMKKFTGILSEIGSGIYLFFLIPFLTIFATEARMNVYFLPFFVLPVILMLKDFNITGKLCLLLTFFSFLFSKIYIPMYNMPDSVPDKMTFHNQLLYINFFTISNRPYYFLAVLITAVTAVIIFLFKKSGINLFHKSKS